MFLKKSRPRLAATATTGCNKNCLDFLSVLVSGPPIADPSRVLEELFVATTWLSLSWTKWISWEIWIPLPSLPLKIDGWKTIRLCFLFGASNFGLFSGGVSWLLVLGSVIVIWPFWSSGFTSSADRYTNHLRKRLEIMGKIHRPPVFFLVMLSQGNPRGNMTFVTSPSLQTYVFGGCPTASRMLQSWRMKV